jgi:small ligand-binding sensory domain FIST
VLFRSGGLAPLEALERCKASSFEPPVMALREAIKEVVAAIEQSQSADGLFRLVHQVEKLRLEPGDLLLVKMGDPQTGWIPAPENVERLQDLLTEAFDRAGVDAKVSAVLWNYAIETKVIHAAPKEE